MRTVGEGKEGYGEKKLTRAEIAWAGRQVPSPRCRSHEARLPVHWEWCATSVLVNVSAEFNILLHWRYSLSCLVNSTKNEVGGDSSFAIKWKSSSEQLGSYWCFLLEDLILQRPWEFSSIFWLWASRINSAPIPHWPTTPPFHLPPHLSSPSHTQLHSKVDCMKVSKPSLTPWVNINCNQTT